MSHSIIRLASFLLVFGLVVAAFCLDNPATAGSLAQNSNSSVTAAPQEEPNMNANKPTRRRGRRARRPAAAPADMTAMPADTGNLDLSGTYNGTFECADAGVSGQTTLTITGNDFTLTDGKTGRIVANTTRGYTGVAMQFGELTLATAKAPAVVPVIVSMRAKKAGKRLTMTTVPGAGRVCSFTP